ncbi:MAG: 50S ribosomal protein L3 [Alphaproteobacteria bacterium]
MRVGLVAEKLGMSRIFNEAGEHVPVTVLLVEDCQVVGLKTQDQHGYSAVQVGYGKGRAKSLNKPEKGLYAKLKMEVKKGIREFRITEGDSLEVGAELKADHFQIGQFVDVVGTSLGKGFAGVIKRHNFSMNRATHGASVCHRSHGATGQRQDPGRVFKGKKMAGHLGAERVTIQNLKVVQTDPERGLLYIRGAIPGHKGSVIIIQDAVKKTVNK